MRKKQPVARQAKPGSASTLAPAYYGSDPNQKLRTRSLLVIALILLGPAALLSFFLLAARGPKTTMASLPEIDLSRASPEAAQTLRSRIQTLRQNPGDSSAWGWLGALLWAYDMRVAARTCLSEAEHLEPTNPRWPYYHALSLVVATPNEALPYLQKAVALCGNTPPAPRLRLAQLLAEQGRWSEACRESQSLLSDQPEFAPALLLSARAAQSDGRIDEALQLARRCLADPLTTKSAHLLLGTLLRLKGDLPGATAALTRATALTDEPLNDPFKAEAMLLRGDPRLLCEQSHPLLAAGQLKEAEVLIEQLRTRHPDYAETWLLVGRLQLLRKDMKAATESLRRHLQMEPSSTQGHFQLGLALLSANQANDAAGSFREAVKLKPDFGPAWYNLGVALSRSEKLREGAEAVAQSIRHNPERIESHLYLAELNLRLGATNDALRVLDQACPINPDDPRLRTLRLRLQPPSD